MKRPVVFLFSGQGAQYYQMGKILYEREPEFRKWMDYCSDIIEPMLGISLAEMLYRDRASKFEPFDRTLYTHPTVVIFSYSLSRCFMSKGFHPDLLVGYSLGEYTALLVAEALPLEAGLAKVVGQARLLERKCEKAGMIAVLANPKIMEREPDIFRDCWLAGHNFPAHFVATGRHHDLKRVDEAMKARKIATQLLPISHGFHSPLVEPIAEDCRTLFAGFKPPRIPMISALLTTQLADYDSARHLWQVLRRPVPFMKTIQRMEDNGPYTYIDVGPAGTLSTFTRYCFSPKSRSEAVVVVNPFGKDLEGMAKMKDAITREI